MPEFINGKTFPAPQYTMPNTYLDKAIAAVPKFGERI